VSLDDDVDLKIDRRKIAVDSGIRYALIALAIRPFLGRLAAGSAATVEQALADALRRPEADRGEAVREVLAEHKSTWRWTQNALGWSTAMFLAVQAPGGDPVPGLPQAYTCPVAGDETWFRRDAAEPVPDCRTHRVQLEPIGP